MVFHREDSEWFIALSNLILSLSDMNRHREFLIDKFTSFHGVGDH